MFQYKKTCPDGKMLVLLKYIISENEKTHVAIICMYTVNYLIACILNLGHKVFNIGTDMYNMAHTALGSLIVSQLFEEALHVTGDGLWQQWKLEAF